MWVRPRHPMTSHPCWAWMWVMETQTCTSLGECFVAQQAFRVWYDASNEWSGSAFNHSKVSPLFLHLLTHSYNTHSSVPLIALSAVDPCVLLCVIYLQGCRKWILWLTKGWKMSSSQTSGARSAWSDSAPLVMCWSVMAFIINTYANSHR